MARQLGESSCGRAVITVCGGSGVGKSEIASLISYYLNAEGVGAYPVGGHHPRRYPEQNDAERRRVFHDGGLKGLVANGITAGTRRRSGSFGPRMATPRPRT